MAAYFIADGFVKNRDALEKFRARAAPSVTQYGGHYLVRAETVERLEGSWSPQLVIVIEFPDIERARIWYRSAEYAAALSVRDDALGRHLILVDGVNSAAR
ncbi:MAG: DUF1330 domain-containing protein [Xanthobacteraceae bacterium]|jgi:uncharacterized protein (DUF1330 family)